MNDVPADCREVTVYIPRVDVNEFTRIFTP